MAKKTLIITTFPTLLATGGFFLSALTTIAQAAPVATEFMSDYVPSECAIRLGYATANAADLSQTLDQDFEQAVSTVVEDQPITLCDAVIGTDSGESRNFNFIHADEGVYKIVTESTYRYDEESTTYVFNVLGVRFIPIATEGTLDASGATTMFALTGSVCATDTLDEPFEVRCEFAAVDSDEGEITAGQLSYAY